MNNIYIWGTGKIASYICETYMDKAEISDSKGFIDNDMNKIGKTFKGKPVFPPTILEKETECQIIILAAAYETIEKQVKMDYPQKNIKFNNPLLFTKYRLLSRYENEVNEEILKIVDYLKNHDLHIFNYYFTQKYDDMDIQIQFDKRIGLYYALFEGKPMYFARYINSWEKAYNYYKFISLEQDLESPHRYITDDFNIDENSIIVDAGAAEGNFGLSVVEGAKKLYLFEPSLNWVEALQYTFAPYKEKVVIVNRYLSDYVSTDTIKLDELISNERVNFIKLDIEGEEYHALRGAEQTILHSDKIKCVACTYHQENDFIAMSEFFRKFNMEIKASKGYMWFPYDRDPVYSLPSLRRGLIRAEKKTNENEK